MIHKVMHLQTQKYNFQSTHLEKDIDPCIHLEERTFNKNIHMIYAYIITCGL